MIFSKNQCLGQTISTVHVARTQESSHRTWACNLIWWIHLDCCEKSSSNACCNGQWEFDVNGNCRKSRWVRSFVPDVYLQLLHSKYWRLWSLICIKAPLCSEPVKACPGDVCFIFWGNLGERWIPKHLYLQERAACSLQEDPSLCLLCLLGKLRFTSSSFWRALSFTFFDFSSCTWSFYGVHMYFELWMDSSSWESGRFFARKAKTGLIVRNSPCQKCSLKFVEMLFTRKFSGTALTTEFHLRCKIVKFVR